LKTTVTAPPVNSFKNRPNKYWSTQELKYNRQLEITSGEATGGFGWV